MTTRRAWLALSTFGAIGLCPTRSIATEDAASVYETVYAYLGQFLEQGRILYVLERPLDPSSILSKVELKATGLSASLSTQSRNVPKSSNARVLSNAEYFEIFSEQRGCTAAWKEFHLRYPEAQALVELSGVAIDKARRKAVALVGVGTACVGATVSEARFVRSGAAWRLTTFTGITVS
jgi:hypothetical protein